MLGGDGLDRVLEGQDVVGGAQGIVEAEVDLVLTQGDLVMAHLHLQAHARAGQSISSVRTRTASSLAEKSK